MYSRHQARFDTVSIIDDFCQRCQAVRRAGSIGNDFLAGVLIRVNPTDEHICLFAIFSFFGRSRKDDVFGTGLQMFFCQFRSQETSRRFNDVFGTDFVPFQIGRVFFLSYADMFAIDDEFILFYIGFYFTMEAAMHGIVFQKICHVIYFAKVIDCYNIDVIPLHGSTKNQTSDTAKTVNANIDHENTLLFLTIGTSLMDVFDYFVLTMSLCHIGNNNAMPWSFYVPLLP